MSNKSGNAYGLTTLCPIINGTADHQSYSSLTREKLQAMPLDDLSPWSEVPNTYLCRLYVLNDVIYNPVNTSFIIHKQPKLEEHLKSKYLVFTSNFHGDLEPYLTGMWENAEQAIRETWQYCVAFEKVDSAQDFIDYIKKCQLETTFYFNGSTDDSLDEQLKSLYLKQEFSKFAYENQGKDAAALQKAFLLFVDEVQPENLSGPTWHPGKHSL